MDGTMGSVPGDLGVRGTCHPSCHPWLPLYHPIPLPLFWNDNAKLWVRHSEVLFAANNITCDLAKYYYTVSYLTDEAHEFVSDILQYPPEEMYGELKSALLQGFAEPPEEEGTYALERGLTLDDTQPSALVEEMMRLSGEEFDESKELQTLWIHYMPQEVTEKLTTDPKLPLKLQAQMSDCIMRKHWLEDITDRRVAEHVTEEISRVDEQIERLTNRIDRTMRIKALNRNRCYFYSKFGDPTKKCCKSLKCSYRRRQ